MHPILADARAYWDSRLAGRSMPSRRDFDPLLEVPKLVPWMILTDVLASPRDFRYRLIGTGVAARSRRDYTGKRFSELPHAGPDSQIWKDRVAVVETGAPLFAQPPYTGGDIRVRSVAGIHMPLSDDGAAVDMIMTVVAYSRERRA
jgi:hypothetical protein